MRCRLMIVIEIIWEYNWQIIVQIRIMMYEDNDKIETNI